ncbi:MAG: glycosyl transferase [Fibrobacteria bacterium]|jgi:GT2 family glycosyltransferase|nr:glycosyl transferase [Fibrobacteria bacterium]
MKSDPPLSGPRFSVLIIGYRSLRFLDGLFKSLAASGGPSREILFLDNHSPEPEAEWIRENLPEGSVRLFDSSENLYFAGGVNFLARQARGEVLVLLNADTWVEPDWLEVLDASLRREHYAVAGLEIRQLSEPDGPANVRSCLDPFGLTHYVPLSEFSDPDRLFVASGSGMSIRRDVFFEAGGLDESFKMYFEEADFCWRVNLMGYTVGLARGAVVNHVGQGSSKRSRFDWNRFRGRRNRIWSYAKNAGPLLLLVFIPSHALIALAAIGFSLLRGRFRAAWAETMSLAAAVAGIGVPLSKRGAIQKMRALPDRELFRKGFLVFGFRHYLRRLGWKP